MAKSAYMGEVDYAPGQPAALPAGAVYEGVKQLQPPRLPPGTKLQAHGYIHRESGRRYFLVPLGRPPLGGRVGGWRLYEYGPGDCPCTHGAA